MTAAVYDLYTNVTSAENFLTNIKTTAVSNGWILDADSIATTGELYVHSLGEYNNQLLYFSFKIMTAADDVTKKYIVWHCNKGYSSGSAWNDQTGKFSVLPVFDYGTTPWQWLCDLQFPQSSLYTYWVIPTIEKQYVFVTDQFIFCTQKIINTDSSGNSFSGWCSMFVGAADSLNSALEDSLGLSMVSSWNKNGYIGSILHPYMKIPQPNSYWSRYNYGVTKTCFGFDYDGKSQFDLPPLDTTAYFGYTATPPTKFITTSINLISGRQTITGNSYAQKQYQGNYPYIGSSASLKNFIYGINYAGGLMKNKSSATLTMVKPIIFNYENVGGIVYYYPTRASLPYYATRMNPYHQPEDIITVGARNFMLFPLFDINDYFGIGIEIEAT